MQAPKGHGLAIPHARGEARLKWHRLRRRLRDPLFSAETMAQGFALGASMELDLRVRADGGFVVLHDADLARETDGHGVISALTGTELAPRLYRDGARPVILSEDLARQMTAAHPRALIQFDMKDDYASIGPAGIAHLARHFSDATAQIIVSADCPNLITEVRRHLPMLQRGIDPTDRLVALSETAGIGMVEAALLAEVHGPTAPDTIYLAWELILRAHAEGLDMVALCQAEGRIVDAWTFTPRRPENGLTAREAADFAALMALGPDQVTTDEPLVIETHWNGVRKTG